MAAAAPPAGVELSKRTLTFALSSPADPTDVVTIRNPTDTPHYFKVKTTNPHRYIVRPNLGIVRAGGAVDITVALHAAAGPAPGAATPDPPVPGPSKDKFLVQSAPVADVELSAASFWVLPDAAAAAAAVKLRVAFVSDHDAAQAAPADAEVAAAPGLAHAVAPMAAAVPATTSTAGEAVLPDAAELLRPGNAGAARERVETLQNTVDERAKTLAARKTELSETRAETAKVLNDAPRVPLAADTLATDPFGGVSIAAICIFILLFAVVLMTVF